MTKIDVLQLGLLGANCYLVRAEGEKHCAVIDPGGDGEAILAKAAALGLTVSAVLLTHCHFDHVGGLQPLAAVAPVYLHPGDLTLPEFLTAGPLPPANHLAEGQGLTLAGLVITVFHTPGHTPGSVCFLTGDALFTGDTLFAGSCGRTDLPGGDPGQMAASLARLAALDYHGQVYPGHGPATGLDQERRHNPCLREVAGA
ncbi:MAG TPA: MBL fold metallo-hydrolase [Candidatus Faecousia faecigallinarum]|nr:MBL fold metallo-hydrolase [Candidatus Faecousia faecigallinarum]